MNIQVNVTGFLNAYEYEDLTVGVAATPLTATKLSPTDAFSGGGKARLAIITVEGRVRYRLGADPTGTSGHVLNDGDVLTLAGTSTLSGVRFIREGGEVANATLRVSYLR